MKIGDEQMVLDDYYRLLCFLFVFVSGSTVAGRATARRHPEFFKSGISAMEV